MIVGADSGEAAPALVDAIHRDRLASWVEAADAPASVIAAARSACETIRADNAHECDRLTGLLGARGVSVTAISASSQRHTVVIEVAPGDAERAATVVREAGYRSPRVWARGAASSLRRTGDVEILTRAGDASGVVQVRWRAPRAAGRSRRRRLFAPTAADWDVVELPVRLWWAYALVRPLRLVAERVGLRSTDHAALEPHLSTPASLIEPLLEFAQVGIDDVVFDFGCGDGRFVVTAAAATGCRAIGVEQSAELIAEAAERAHVAGVADRIRLVAGDAAAADLSEVTAVVLFLPMVVAARVVPELLSQLSPGARVVLHEQTPLASTILSPDAVAAVVAADAVTVAHRWVVPPAADAPLVTAP